MHVGGSVAGSVVGLLVGPLVGGFVGGNVLDGTAVGSSLNVGDLLTGPLVGAGVSGLAHQRQLIICLPGWTFLVFLLQHWPPSIGVFESHLPAPGTVGESVFSHVAGPRHFCVCDCLVQLLDCGQLLGCPPFFGFMYLANDTYGDEYGDKYGDVYRNSHGNRDRGRCRTPCRDWCGDRYRDRTHIDRHMAR